MINGVVIREQDAFTDYRGDLYTIWKNDDFNLKWKTSDISIGNIRELRELKIKINKLKSKKTKA